MSDEVLRAIGKNMDQINKTAINDISISCAHENNHPYFAVSCIYLDDEIFVMKDLL